MHEETIQLCSRRDRREGGRVRMEEMIVIVIGAEREREGESTETCPLISMSASSAKATLKNSMIMMEETGEMERVKTSLSKSLIEGTNGESDGEQQGIHQAGLG